MHPGQKAPVTILSASGPQHPVKAKRLPNLSGQNSRGHLNSFLTSPTSCGCTPQTEVYIAIAILDQARYLLFDSNNSTLAPP